jgi:hypothetical protein
MSKDLAYQGAEPASRTRANPVRSAGHGPSLLPVGTPGGINSGFDGVPAGSGMVRLGRYIVHLEAETYRLWRMAFAAPERDRLVAWARSEGLTDVEQRIAELESDELLVEECPALAERVGVMAVRLLGECLGNGTKASSSFQVVGRSGTLLTVNPYLYEILLRSDGATPLARICGALESTWPPSARASCLEAFCRVLPELVRNQVVLLDAV